MIYINDIADEIESNILIFADDTYLFASGKDPSQTAKILNRDLENYLLWQRDESKIGY